MRAFESTLKRVCYALTLQDFPNYSALMNAAIDAHLDTLEQKIRQAADLCQRLRDENRELRQRIASLEGTRRDLEDKIQGARARLENLLQRIPE